MKYWWKYIWPFFDCKTVIRYFLFVIFQKVPENIFEVSMKSYDEPILGGML